MVVKRERDRTQEAFLMRLGREGKLVAADQSSLAVMVWNMRGANDWFHWRQTLRQTTTS